MQYNLKEQMDNNLRFVADIEFRPGVPTVLYANARRFRFQLSALRFESIGLAHVPMKSDGFACDKSR